MENTHSIAVRPEPNCEYDASGRHGEGNNTGCKGQVGTCAIEILGKNCEYWVGLVVEIDD